MALRGDLVGEAFVRITADTTAMRQAIRRAGEEDGKAYGERFSAEVDRAADNTYRRSRQRLAAAISDPKQFDDLAKNYKSAEEAADGFRKMLADLDKQQHFGASRMGQYNKAVKDWEVSTVNAREAARELAEQNKRDADAKVVQTKQLKHFFAEQDRGYKSLLAARRHDAAEDERIQKLQLRNFFVLQEQGYKRLQVARRRELVDFQRTNVDHNRVSRAAGAAVDAVLPDWRTTRFARGVDAMVVGLDRLDRRFTLFNHGVGRMFGKGSRNNFVNWTGSMVEGLTTLGTKVVTFPLRGFASIFNTFSDTFSESRALGASKLLSAGRGLLAVFGKGGGLIGAVAGLAVGALAIGKLLPGIVSLMTMLGGVVSSLIGSIGIGLTGALFALVPAAAGAVAGFGGLVSVFYGFFKDKNNAKYVTNLFKPFKDLSKSYYPQVRTFLTDIKGGFKTLITDVKPSIDTFFKTWQTRMNDLDKRNKQGIVVKFGTRGSLEKWSDSIGKIAKSLSSASTSLASGLVGFFVPILPFAERLANYLDRAFATFDKWANSKGGREAITGFMEKAWVAADKVWKILGNIGGIMGSVFMGGEDTGTSFLDGILTKLQEINTTLKTPEGQEKLKTWFGSVKEIGDGVGRLATDVGRIVTNFNSPEGQANAKGIMDAIVGIGDAAVKVSEVADAIEFIASYLLPIGQIFTFLGLMKDPNLGRGSADTSRPTSVPKQVPVIDQPGVKDSLSKYEATLKVTPELDTKTLNLEIAAIEAYKSSGVQIPIKGNETLWEQTKGTIAMTIFAPKQIPISADPTLWNQTKGTVQSFVFDSKSVIIEANTKPVKSAIDNVKKWLASLPASKTIRVAGVNSQGGIPVGASGMMLDQGPRLILAGEAGREALVPLDRPLSMVDPAVRALSAIAQGKANYSSGGVIGQGRTLNIHPGAIVVNSPLSDPALVAESVLDRLVAFA